MSGICSAHQGHDPSCRLCCVPIPGTRGYHARKKAHDRKQETAPMSKSKDWRVDKNGFVRDGEGKVAVVPPAISQRSYEEQDAMMALVCRAVNCHAALLAALEQILADWDAVPGHLPVPDEINDNGHWDAVRTAIAQATEAGK